ncbi:metallophosphoesterase [Streptomyces sp.]|uniref:metallophosphoesterase family protein n=1 Tax=Streptomyces sp. TaxID=1931 RepID=UPI002D771B6C|nr:metallophosphoesterase [Streptomyces sp.]HET6355351.1 metallophosphoesterase [Streptomyces sp.]
MGLRYDLPSSPVVAHLISGSSTPPRVTHAEVEAFLRSLQHDHDRMISLHGDFEDDVRRAARESTARLLSAPFQRWDDYLPHDALESCLAPLARIFRSYGLLVLPIGNRQHQRDLDRFAGEAARAPAHGILTLIPGLYQPTVNVQVLDPDDGVRDALRRRDEWPGAIFILRDGRSVFLPLDTAYERLATIVRSGLPGHDPARTWSILSEEEERQGSRPPVRRRLLHLSDLHLGTRRAARAQDFLLANLGSFMPLDHVVISGDLFDNPLAKHREAYEHFVNQVRRHTGRLPVVVPGNHDQRILGNSFWRLGSRRRQMVELDWSRGLVHDAETRTAFFCFDSANTGNMARGSVSQDQLLRVGTKFDTENLDAELQGHLRIAVVHHHPYPYPAPNETPVTGPRKWPVRERLLEMTDAQSFLTWCAGRDIGLVLHGHRHVPRLVIDDVATGQKRGQHRQITTVGCGTSLGAGGAPMSFNVIEWNAESLSWSVDFQISRPDGQGFHSTLVQASSPPGRG